MADESRDNSSTDRTEEVTDSESSTSTGGRQASSRTDTDGSVLGDVALLESVLRRTRRQLGKPALLEGALWYGTTVVAVVVAALLAAAFVPDHGYTVGRWMMALGFGSATVGAGAAAGYWWWRRPSLEHVAARIQRHSTEFRSDLVAALEFGRALCDDGGQKLADQGTSPAMAKAHVRRTAGRVRAEADNLSLAHCVPARDLTPATLGFAAAVAVLLIPLIFNPGWTLGVLTGERLGAPVVGERVVEKTMVGSVEAVFVYPSYTGQDRQMRNLGTGRIESLEGTEVHLHTTLMPGDWASIEMVVETGDDDKEVVDMRFDGGHQASASITLEESGHYWFRGKTVEGRPVEDRTRRRIEVRRDEPPQITIVSHDGRVEVEPDDVVEFELEATDTFGIDTIQMVHHFEGVEDNPERERLRLSELADQPTTVETSVEFDLAPLDLRPKDAIVVYFEARDVNTATGPGETKSEPVVLYVESPEDKHMENIVAQQEVMEVLVSHLGDVLESPVGERQLKDDNSYGQQVDTELSPDERRDRYRRTRRLNDQRESMVEAMESVVERLEEDPMMVARNLTLFKGVAGRLESIHSEGEQLFDRLDNRANRRDLTAAHLQQVADFAADCEQRLERMVLDLEDLLVSQKMDLVETTAEQIEEMRDRLRDLLEQYRDTEDPELREAIQREMDRLRQRMQELMSRMQMQMRQMPQEHVNLEALEGMDLEQDTDDLAGQLDAIDEMLADDDIDGALQALDEMEGHLDAMSGEMESTFGEMQPRGISEFDEAMGEMMDEVTVLQEMEAELEEDTRDLQQQLREERREQLEEMLDPVTDRLQSMIDAQHRDLDVLDDRPLAERDQREVNRSSRSVDRLEEMVQQQDMEEALQRARSSRRALRSMRSTMNLSRRYTEEGTDQARALDRSVADSDELIERSEQIIEEIEDFMAQAQQDLQPEEQEQFDELADRQQEIGERAEQLGEQIEQQAQDHPQLLEELGPALEGAEEAMQSAEQNLRERQLQPALDDEREALQQLGQLDDSMSQAMQQQRQREREERGHRRSDDEEVEIPGEDGDAEARERIREEMMEGMRDGRIGEYESEIERYFRSLVE